MIRRVVFHLGGFDPVTPGSFFERFDRQLAVFQKTWNVHATVQNVGRSTLHRCDLKVGGNGWSTETSFRLWAWDDIVADYAAQPVGTRLAAGAKAYWDLLISGTIARYFKANVRYGLFSLTPPLLVLFAIVAALTGGLVLYQVLPRSPFWTVFAGALPAFLALAFLRWATKALRVSQALDDWIFSLDFIYGQQPDLSERIEAFAEALLTATQESSVDEVLLVGHSLGATFAIEVLAKCHTIDSAFATRGPRIGLLTVGATIPKCALHPAATDLRTSLTIISKNPDIDWVEVQSRADPISFYKFHPSALARVDDEQPFGKPTIRRVQIHDMVEADTFERIRRRPMRLHYQSVMANDRRAAYDYYLLIGGPFPFRVWASDPSGFLGLRSFKEKTG